MKILTLFGIGVSLLASCMPTTPQSRISDNPRKFFALSAKHQMLVRQGEIASGMPRAAVELAWGEPSRRFQGATSRHASERWDYTETKPVYSNSFYGGLNSYSPYGRHGRDRYSGLGFGIGPEISYQPAQVASVWFVGNRVDSWERLR